ncbi:pentapeptide repeat-containing protein [Campylobacter sp.]|uniref:pentapeptide repeat-containing protein n=1 Tax=Campylobacter sp. TaxID=205 RepID=UPI0038B23891
MPFKNLKNLEFLFFFRNSRFRNSRFRNSRFRNSRFRNSRFRNSRFIAQKLALLATYRF